MARTFQTDYEFRDPRGIEGEVYDGGFPTITLTAVNIGTTVIPFGRGVQLNNPPTLTPRGNREVRLAYDAAEQNPIWGVAAYSDQNEKANDANGDIGYPSLSDGGYKPRVVVIRKGIMLLWSEEAVTAGDPVYCRVTAASAPNNRVGRFRNDEATGEAVLIANAQFMETTLQPQLVKVYIDCLSARATPITPTGATTVTTLPNQYYSS